MIEESIVNDKQKIYDINLEDYTICTKSLEKKISNKTSPIIAVHL